MRSVKPDPGPGDGAPAEPQRVHQHDPRPARRPLPRREGLSRRRLRRRLRQHRRRADGLAAPDGAYLSAAERIAAMGDLHGRSPAKPLEIDYRARDQRDPPRSIAAPSKPSTASSSPASTSSASAFPASAPVDGRDAAPVTLGFWMDGKLLATQDGRDEAVGARLLQSVLRRRDAAVPARRRSRLPRRVHRRRVREDAAADGRVRPTGRTSSSTRSSSSGRSRRRRRRRAGRRS